MKKLSALLTTLMFYSLSAIGQEFLYTCISDKNWVMNFIINTENKSVLFKSSGDFEGKETYSQDMYENVIHFSRNEISVIDIYEDSISYRTFYLKENIMINTGHYQNGYIDNQNFNCIKG